MAFRTNMNLVPNDYKDALSYLVNYASFEWLILSIFFSPGLTSKL